MRELLKKQFGVSICHILGHCGNVGDKGSV